MVCACLCLAAPVIATAQQPDDAPAEEITAGERARRAMVDAFERARAVVPTTAGGSEELAPRVLADIDDAPAEDAQLQGKRIGRVQFDCDLPACRDPVAVEAFREITGLYVGQTYTTQVLRRAEIRLAKTGFFDALQVEKELIGTAVHLRIDATGSTLIRKVQFEGVSAPPFESDLRKILSYRQGQAYRKDSDKANAQLEALQALYEREGYFGTEIAMVTRKARKHEVDLVFRVKKGTRRRICGVGLRGITAMTYAEARAVLLSDFSFLPRRLGIFPLNFTARGFKAGQDALVQAYRRRGYFQARINEKSTNLDAATGCVVLAVDVTEGPRWTLSYTGSNIFDDSELADQMPFYESGYVDDEEIRRGARSIESLYETRGYPFARVRGKQTRRDQLDRLLEFEIDEGPQLEIAEIVLHGNTHIASDVLTADLGTRPFGLFETGGYLQTDQLLADFGAIEEIYRKRGYLTASVRRFEVEVLDRRDVLRIHVYINEGPRVIVERVDIDGNRVMTDPALVRGLSAQRGRPFVPLDLKADLTKLLQQYSALGYPMTKVETRCRLMTGEEVACEAPRRKRACVARSIDELEGRCSWNDAGDRRFVCVRSLETDDCAPTGGVSLDRVNIVHTVSEGPRVTVGPILLKGNFDTSSAVIYREVPLGRDDLLDTQRVIEGQGNLRSLNLFDSVSIETVGLDDGVRDEAETVAALLINVEESRTRDIDLKFGVELRDLFSEGRQFLVTGEAEYSDRNLTGRGFGIKPRIISAVDTLDVSRFLVGATEELPDAAQIRSIDFVLGAELIFSHPRFLKSAFGVDKLFATLAPFYIIDLVGVINRQVLREEGGIRLEFRKELVELLKRLFLKLRIEVKSIASFQQGGPVVDGERIFSPRRTIGKFTPELALDRRDSPLNPTRGFIVRLEPSIVSGNALGRGRERFARDSFLRLTPSFSFYLQPWRGFVLGQAVRAGQVFPLVDREIPVEADELYFLGGVSSVRGFPDGALGPLNSTQRPGGGEFMLNYNIELRYPLLREYSIYGATFFDAGLLADCRGEAVDGRNCYRDAFGDSPLESVRTSMGVGVRALFLDQIPVVLDYGIVLNRVPGERFGQIHLNVGYTFD